MKHKFDVVVVGSGPAGVHAAYPLINAGLKVAIIDGGLDNKKKDDKLSDFLYSNFSETSIAYDLIKKNSYVFNKTYHLLKIKSDIEIIQTLAKGGLAQHWHGICDFFSNEELGKIGLPAKEIQKEYKLLAKIINLNLNAKLDYHCRTLLKSVKSNKLVGFANQTNWECDLYQVPVVYRYKTSSLIEEFKKFKNFTFIPNQLVTTVKDKKGHLEIESYSIDKSNRLITNTKYLILAAGAINTTRILLRSLGLYNYQTTFLTKAHYITACLHPKVIFRTKAIKKQRWGQLAISVKDSRSGLSPFFIQIYRFNPLVINKVIKFIPLPKFISLPALSAFAHSLMMADIRFASSESKNKSARLIRNGKDDILEINFSESNREKNSHKEDFKAIVKQLRKWKLYPVKTVKDYTTSHYAGGIPYQKRAGKLSVDINGRLHQAKRIFIADSSTWRALPAKPPTLTIMANAARIGKTVLRIFRQK